MSCPTCGKAKVLKNFGWIYKAHHKDKSGKDCTGEVADAGAKQLAIKHDCHECGQQSVDFAFLRAHTGMVCQTNGCPGYGL